MKIIAEVGSNWRTPMDCIASITRAKESGADAVKFQYFSAQDLYGAKSKTSPIGESPYLDSSWIPNLAQHCTQVGIEFMCTAFSARGYEFIDQFVKTHKIASAEITDFSILETVNSFKKPVCLSTGGATIEQIQDALDRLVNCEVTIMYCVTDYPARVVDFAHLGELQRVFSFKYQYGYSDHSIDVLNIPLIAQSMGCTVIEKHVNFTPHQYTNDAPHSLNFDEFSLMVKRLKHKDISLAETFKPCGWQRRLVGEEFVRPS